MVLSQIDRDLLERCLRRSPEAWSDFVDRYVGLVAHVVDHTAAERGVPLDATAREDLVSEVFLSWVEGDFAVLRRFRGASSLATYLTVIARRLVVHSLRKDRFASRLRGGAAQDVEAVGSDAAALRQLENREQLEAALQNLSDAEAVAVRMYHLEGRSYREIGSQIGMAENSIGPFLTRAREKMRRSV